MKKNTKLSLILPCYNEEKRFTEGFNHFHDYFKNQDYSWEILLVNDGSQDKTLELLKGVSKSNIGVNYITYNKNKGKGYAIIQGVNKAIGKYVLFSDIDHSVSIETIEGFFKYFDSGYQAVIGSRRVKGSKFLKRQKPFREFLGRGFTLLVRILINWKIKDATCGFKAFENKKAQEIFNKISIFDWAFDAEILYICKKFNIDYAQAPVAWKDVKGSKVSVFRDIFRSLIGLITIRLNDLQNKY